MHVTILNSFSIITLLGVLSPCHLFNITSNAIQKQFVSNRTFTEFDMKLFEAANKNVRTNVLISPLNFKIGMGIIMEGAVGSTANEIIQALQLPGDVKLARKQIEEWMLRLVRYTPIGDDWPIIPQNISVSNVIVVNQFFLNSKYESTLMNDYRKKLQKFYVADFTILKERNASKIVDAVNSWMFNRTLGLIPSLAEETDLSKNFELALGNVIYFKRKWLYKFSKAGAKCFYKDGKHCKRIDMMLAKSALLRYNYIEELDADVVDIPYADSIHSMVILLPKNRKGIHRLLQNTNLHKIDEVVYTKLREEKLNLLIPKFVVEYKINGVEILKSFGISKVFNPGATLYALVNEGSPVYVSQIFHTAKISVNEEGKEEAILEPKKASIISFVADHPFIYTIRNVSDNAMLFVGKYLGP